MKKRFFASFFTFTVLFILMLFACETGFSQKEISFDKYHTNSEINSALQMLNKSNPKNTALHKIAVSPGGNDLTIIEIGPDAGKSKKNYPAVLVTANMEGTTPLATEAALYLAKMLLNDDSKTTDVSWYILCSGNPDAANNFVQKPLWAGSVNHLASNDDMDDATDEDGFEDLDGNNIITQIRVKALDGEWLPDENDARIMRKADPEKDETGTYKIYTEGIDNDGDGLYNEDTKGGVNVGINFPQDFKHFTSDAGKWAGSTSESFGLMKFVYEHPEIAMTFTFGATNFCLYPPENKMKIQKPSQQSGSRRSQQKIPGRWENKSDLAFYAKLSEEFKKYLDDKNINGSRLKSEKEKAGSFELWAYHQLGVPAFSLDFWAIPAIESDKGKGKMDTDSLRKQNKENLKKHDKKDAKANDPKAVALLTFSDKVLDGKGFVNWKAAKHPQLGDVEIGGFVPFADNTPPADMIDSLLANQLPWVLILSGKLPRLKIAETKITAKGGGVFDLEIWIENTGFLPFPTEMGKQNRQPAPAILTIEGKNLTFLSGKKRTPISGINGNGYKKLTWLIHSDTSGNVELKLDAVNTWDDNKQIKLGGVK